MILATAGARADFTRGTTEGLRARRDTLTSWRDSRVLPPDEDMLDIIAAAIDTVEAELMRREARHLALVPSRAEVPEVGALAAWRDEMRRGVAGQRTSDPNTWRPCYLQDGTWTDPLRAAACREASGRDMDGNGLHSVGDSYRREAAEILAESAEGSAA